MKDIHDNRFWGRSGLNVYIKSTMSNDNELVMNDVGADEKPQRHQLYSDKANGDKK